MLLRSQHCSSPLLAWKGRSQKALLRVLFFLRSFMLSKASSRSQVMEQDCHWVLSRSVLPNKPFPFFSSFFPPKKVIKKDRPVSEIRWNSLGCCWHFTVPWEVVQLCLEATGCQQECGSQAEAFHKTQHLATHPQEFRPGNVWQHFCTLEHEQPVVPGPVSSARGAKFSQCFSSILQLWELSAGIKFESQFLKSSTSASKQDCSGSEQNHHWPDTKSF